MLVQHTQTLVSCFVTHVKLGNRYPAQHSASADLVDYLEFTVVVADLDKYTHVGPHVS